VVDRLSSIPPERSWPSAGRTVSYGALRGRGMAGLKGHPRARIFCVRNEAELLAISGLALRWWLDDRSPGM